MTCIVSFLFLLITVVVVGRYHFSHALARLGGASLRPGTKFSHSCSAFVKSGKVLGFKNWTPGLSLCCSEAAPSSPLQVGSRL